VERIPSADRRGFSFRNKSYVTVLRRPVLRCHSKALTRLDAQSGLDACAVAGVGEADVVDV
jgi:hypothetical protein